MLNVTLNIYIKKNIDVASCSISSKFQKIKMDLKTWNFQNISFTIKLYYLYIDSLLIFSTYFIFVI